MLEIFLKAAILFPFFFFIPGWLIYTSFVKKKLSLEFAEVVFIQILISILASGWVGLFLAVSGYFSFLNLLLIIFFLSAILFLLNHKSIRNISFRTFHKLRPKKDSKFIILIPILIIAVSLYFPPGENITYNQDDTPIVNHAINIARTGKIVGYDPIFIEVVSNGNGDAFYQMWSSGSGLQFPAFGFYADLNSNSTSFQYFDFYPTLLAIFYSALGFKLFLYLTPIIALLSITAIFITVKHLFTWKVGALSAILLTINFSQIWFARYPGAEILSQLMFFSVVFTIALMLRFKEPFFAFLSAFILGTSLLVRIDTLFTGGAIVLFMIILQLINYDHRKSIYKHTKIFSITFLLLTSWTILHIYLFEKEYIWAQFHHAFKYYLYELVTTLVGRYRIPEVELGLFVYGFPSILLIVSTLMISRSKKRLNLSRHIPYLNLKILRIFFVLLIGMSFVALYITRYPFQTGLVSGKQTLLILQWFLFPVGLFLSIVGLVLIIYDNILRVKILNNDRLLSILCFVMIAFSNMAIFIFGTLRNQPVFPWGFRRYMPIIFPFFIVSTSYTIFRLQSSIQNYKSEHMPRLRKNVCRIASVGLILLLVISMVHMDLDSGILTHREFEGLIEQTEDVASYFDQKSIILFWMVGESTGIAVPLKYNYDKNAIIIKEVKKDDVNFVNQIELWKKDGRHVYLVSLYHPKLEGTIQSGKYGYIFYLDYPLGFLKMEYVGNSSQGPTISSKPYGDIKHLGNFLYVYEIENSSRLIDFHKLNPNLVNTTIGHTFWEINYFFKEVIFCSTQPGIKSYFYYDNIQLSTEPLLKFSIGTSPEAWEEEGDGVLFEIYINEDIVFSKYIDPKNNFSDRKWHNFELDLSGYAGRNVQIKFATSGGSNNIETDDYSLWGDLILINYQE